MNAVGNRDRDGSLTAQPVTPPAMTALRPYLAIAIKYDAFAYPLDLKTINLDPLRLLWAVQSHRRGH